jgi:hypothetical protein
MYISQVSRASKLYNILPTRTIESHSFYRFMNLNIKSHFMALALKVHRAFCFQFPTPHRPPITPSCLKSRADEIASVSSPKIRKSRMPSILQAG